MFVWDLFGVLLCETGDWENPYWGLWNTQVGDWGYTKTCGFGDWGYRVKDWGNRDLGLGKPELGIGVTCLGNLRH